jgi:P-type Ca2+ transporter type 2C
VLDTVPPDASYRGAGPVGLTSAEAERRLARDGPNEVAGTPPPRLLHRIGRQLADPLIGLLVAAAVVTAALRDLTDTAVIVLVVVVNTAIGVVQEVRADRAIAALRRLASPVARVVRDGADRVVPAGAVVRGDTVVLTAGDIVPADLTLTESRQLRLDEAAMTGESVPVDRTAADDLYAGTVVLTGRGVGTVTRTGSASALGRIAALVAGTRPVRRRCSAAWPGSAAPSARSRSACPRWCSCWGCSPAARWSRWRSPRSAWWWPRYPSRCRPW